MQYLKCVRCVILVGMARGGGDRDTILEELVSDAVAFVAGHWSTPGEYVRFVLHLYHCLRAECTSLSVATLVRQQVRELAGSGEWSSCAVYCAAMGAQGVACYSAFLAELADSGESVGLLKDALRRGVFTREQVTCMAKSMVDVAPSVSGAWRDVARPVAVDRRDLSMLDALSLTLAEPTWTDSWLSSCVRRCNLQFARLARDYKEAGCSLVSGRVRECALERRLQARLALMPPLRGPLHALRSWLVFAEVADWISTWDRHHAVSEATEEWARTEAENADGLFECAFRLLRFRGWLRALDGWTEEELDELRGVLLFRLMHRVCRVANLIGRWHTTLRVMSHLADERHHLCNSLSARHLKSLLCLAQEADLALLSDDTHH